MFEETEEKKATSGNKVGMGVALVAAIVVGGILFYTMSKGPANAPAPAATSAAEAAKTPADPLHDLIVQRATMDKDPLGTTALWVLAIENRSKVYTYSEIQYETTYLGANSKPILVNKGTIAASVDPGEQYKSELRDALFPAGTVLYQFKITGAKSSIQ